MLSVDVSAAHVNNVKDLTLIFDENELLQAISFETDKYNFKAIDEYVSQKYQPVKRQVPFVGDKYAEYRSPNALIKINAPHMSFQMTITYVSQDMWDKFNRVSKAEDTQEKNNAAAQF